MLLIMNEGSTDLPLASQSSNDLDSQACDHLGLPFSSRNQSLVSCAHWSRRKMLSMSGSSLMASKDFRSCNSLRVDTCGLSDLSGERILRTSEFTAFYDVT